MTKTHLKEKIFEKALDIVSRDGFAGLTLGGLASDSGLSKSGLFAHFKSKAELESQVIDRVSNIGGASFMQKAMKKRPGLPRLSAFFAGWLGWASKAGLSGGCPIVAAMFELDDAPLDNPTRLKVQAVGAQSRAALTALCQEAVDSGELKADLEIDQFLFELYGIYLSHHIASRFERDEAADRMAMSAFDNLIERNRVTGMRGRIS